MTWAWTRPPVLLQLGLERFGDPRLAADLAVSAGIVVAGVLASFVVIRCMRWASEATAASRFRFDGVLVKALARPAAVVVVALSITYSIRRVPELQSRLNAVGNLDAAVLIVLGTWVMAVLAREVIDVYGQPFVEDTETDFDDRLLQLVDLSATLVIVALGLIMTLSALGISITPFLASMGIVGLAIAMAARTTLGNFFAGLVLALDRTIQGGHRVRIGEDVGDVVDIGRYKTTLRTRDNLIVGIPNDRLMSEAVTNYDLPDALRRVELEIGISYASDIGAAEAILQDIAAGIDPVLGDPAPEVNVQALGDSSVDLKMLVWQGDPKGARRTRDRIYRQALERFASEGIEVPYPHVDVGFRDGPPEASSDA